LGLGESDFYRTRLTHSMEVAQIGTGILRSLKAKYKNQDQEIYDVLPDEALMNAICLAHDIGHPPFGHGGEVALNIRMREHGGFEGNGQTLRILTQLDKYTENYGLNPTRRV
ncbi:dNTP triphosphohydrolase, partial [Acinetobacter bohemicus]